MIVEFETVLSGYYTFKNVGETIDVLINCEGEFSLTILQ